MYKPKSLGNKTILHIDYDSFFASVEQQSNKSLRGKPIIVTGYDVKRGIACAASIQAKKLGIKTGTPYFKAIKICPTLIAVPGNFAKYNYVHKKTLEIFSKYTDTIEVFSIDEAFLDITKTLKFFGGLESLISNIKSDIKSEIGEVVTCSVGASPNKLLSKIASEINKPNGHYILTKENLFETIDSQKLTDFCGLGPRTEQKLLKYGLSTLKKIREEPYENLKRLFGPTDATFLKDLSFGIGNDIVIPQNETPRVKSIGHQHTLTKPTKDLKVIQTNLRRLSEMVARRMRNKNLQGKTVFVSLRYQKGGYFCQRKTVNTYLEAGSDIYKIGKLLLEKYDSTRQVRLVGVSISNLKPCKIKQLDLFSYKKPEITRAEDLIKNKFGEEAIFPASVLIADSQKTGAFNH